MALLIISGPSGAGKDTIIDKLCEASPNIYKIRTSTTRQPREGEVNGVDYDFWDRNKFLEAANSNYFLEHKNVHGNFYGTPLHAVKSIEEGKVAILRIDVQGALEVMPILPEAMTVFISPPSMEVLEKRIRTRALDDEKVIKTRLENAIHEMNSSSQYKFIVINDQLEKAVLEILDLINRI